MITTNGCFDVLHYGHLKFFNRIKELFPENRLVVLINSDEYIRKVKKREPFHNEQQRIFNLKQIKGIAEVKVFYEDTPNEMILKLKPKAHIKSNSGYKGCEEEVLNQIDCALVLLPDTQGFSTTRLLNGKK